MQGMPHLHKKIQKGRPYYYLREIARVEGKPKVVSQIYLGTAENIGRVFEAAEQRKLPIKLHVEEFGAIFIVHEIERQMLDTIGMIDSIVKRGRNEGGPTIGEYFFYAWANRVVCPKSKRALEHWYRKTAIQQIRPIAVEELNSQRYWDKWDRVDAKAVDKIASEFFKKVWANMAVPPESVVFDTTNYFTFLATETESELAQRGKNKAGRDNLRQVGVALMVDRATQVPMYYRAYEGNKHDSKVFSEIIKEMFTVMETLNKTKQRLTLVFDKGMNSDENIAVIDDSPRVHFITSYSPYFAADLASTNIKNFVPLNIKHNLALIEKGKNNDVMLAFRTRREFWGKERTAIVTHNPVSARKKQFSLTKKLEAVRDWLLEARAAYREQKPQWRDRGAIQKRYESMCERLRVGTNLYTVEFGDGRVRPPEMSFKKDSYQISKVEEMHGRNIILTDNHDWSTEEIVQLALDRYIVENQFRSSKSPQNVNMNPFFHWTDSKLRCQILTCVMALTVLRLIELKIQQANVKTPLSSNSGKSIMEIMSDLHSVISLYPGKKLPERHLETPTKTQREVLEAFGWTLGDGWVLQLQG